MAPAEALTEQIVDEKPDRYLIAIGTKIEPRIYRTQAEAESAAETLAFHSRRETATYRLSDAALVSVWREQRLGIPMGEYADFHLDRVLPELAFRPREAKR